MRRRVGILFLSAVFASGSAMASWYDEYDAGLAVARKGRWEVVIQKMSAAIGGMTKETDRVRTYAAVFISYQIVLLPECWIPQHAGKSKGDQRL